MQRPSSQEADLGATVTMQCKVAGNPTPEIDWIYENSDQVSLQSSILRGMRLIPPPLSLSPCRLLDTALS